MNIYLVCDLLGMSWYPVLPQLNNSIRCWCSVFSRHWLICKYHYVMFAAYREASGRGKIETRWRRGLPTDKGDYTSGWPDKHNIPIALRPYFSIFQYLLSWQFNMAFRCVTTEMRNNRTVIPPSLCQDILAKLHTGHQGITKCHKRASQSVWWPSLSKQLE